MTHEKFEGERTLMRIHIGESDKWHGKPLYDAIVEMLRKEGFSGVTVLRGVAGYGGSSVYHTDKILRLSQDLPIVLEVTEPNGRIKKFFPASTRWSKAASSPSKKCVSSSTAPPRNREAQWPSLAGSSRVGASTTDQPMADAPQEQSWLNRTVIGVGLTSLFSDWSHETATAVLPAFLAAIGAGPVWLGAIEGIADGLSSFTKLAAGHYTDRLKRRKPLAVFG